MMTQKEKLIELLSERHSGSYDEALRIADFLIANGVVVLPCKVGDTVYQIGRDFCDKRCHDKCDLLCDGWDDLCPENNGDWEVQTRVFTVGLFDKIGKEIFLTREEAEAAMRQRRNDHDC